MDRYKEGYNDCNREWENKIKDKIKELEQDVTRQNNQELYTLRNITIGKIGVLENLLKKG